MEMNPPLCKWIYKLCDNSSISKEPFFLTLTYTCKKLKSSDRSYLERTLSLISFISLHSSLNICMEFWLIHRSQFVVKNINFGLAGVPQLVGVSYSSWKVAGSIPGHDTYLGCRLNWWSRCPQSPVCVPMIPVQVHTGGNQSMSVSHWCFSLPLLLSKKQWKNVLR